MSECRSCEQKFLISRGLLIRLSTWALVYDMVQSTEYFNYIDHRDGHIIDLLQLTPFFLPRISFFLPFSDTDSVIVEPYFIPIRSRLFRTYPVCLL